MIAQDDAQLQMAACGVVHGESQGQDDESMWVRALLLCMLHPGLKLSDLSEQLTLEDRSTVIVGAFLESRAR